MHKKGFTLLELLMAATVIAALASIATASYKAKMADAYVEDGKNQARALATAVRLFELEYPSVVVREEDGLQGSLGTIPDSCAPTEETAASPAMMVACGFLENRRWGNDRVSLTIKAKAGSTATVVCVNGVEKLGSRYNGQKIFCVNPARGEQEVAG